MSEVAAAVQAALDSGDPVSRDLVVDWCHFGRTDRWAMERPTA
jgi:hypothetical protein